MKSIFTDKSHEPTEENLREALAGTYPLWQSLRDFTLFSYARAQQEWKFSGNKFGWGYRIKDSKRVIIYLLPRQGFFLTAFVFGQKATDEILGSNVSSVIKDELLAAKVYAEGRGIRLTIQDAEMLEDIKRLISIKIAV